MSLSISTQDFQRSGSVVFTVFPSFQSVKELGLILLLLFLVHFPLLHLFLCFSYIDQNYHELTLLLDNNRYYWPNFPAAPDPTPVSTLADAWDYAIKEYEKLNPENSLAATTDSAMSLDHEKIIVFGFFCFSITVFLSFDIFIELVLAANNALIIAFSASISALALESNVFKSS